MKELQYTVTNPVGLHARPASQLIATARTYQCELFIEKGGEIADPKSLMSILRLNVNQGDTIKIVAQGDDEEEAIAGLGEFLREYL